MSLRTLVGRLRRRDWTAATIELVIVVVGILIALQVSNWNQIRGERERGQDYLRRIHQDLTQDRQAIERTLAFWTQVSGYGRTAITFAEGGHRGDASSWESVLAYYQASQLMPFELADTTFVEMRDSGDLGLIADETLRGRLAEYYRLTGIGMRATILRHEPAYRAQIRGLTPWRIQEYIWDTCFRQLDGVGQQLIDCPAPFSEAEAELLLEKFDSDESLLPNLRYWISTLTVSQIVIRSHSGELDTLLESVAVARGRTSL
jgi:hypothetical protein